MPNIEGVEVCEEELYGCSVSTVRILSEQAAKDLGREIGDYITIETGEIPNEHTQIDKVGDCLAEILGRVLRPYYHGKLLVCGIGSKDNAADGLGPEVTYNLPLKALAGVGADGNFREVVSFAPDTEGENNIPTDVLVGGIARTVGADCILLVDSLRSGDPSRLFRTVQLSSNGGLGVHLSGKRGDWAAIGIPVISLGIPMVISLSPGQGQQDMLFTSTEVPSMIAAAGRMIAYAIIRACWPSYTKEECIVLSELARSPVPYSFLPEDGGGQT